VQGNENELAKTTYVVNLSPVHAWRSREVVGSNPIIPADSPFTILLEMTNSSILSSALPLHLDPSNFFQRTDVKP
jgi:hypothetical protein